MALSYTPTSGDAGRDVRYRVTAGGVIGLSAIRTIAAAAATFFRLTEAGDRRITEAGDPRVAE